LEIAAGKRASVPQSAARVVNERIIADALNDRFN
jgi:hypothetical protein